jgi:two-component system cell cycle response regulator
VATRILIIEDNQTNMELMVYLLTAFGYETLTAKNGNEGVERAAGDRPDLIICDLQMPGLNGFQVAQELKGRPELQSIPLIAVTAFAMVGDRDKILKAGFDGYIAKPIYPETFVKQIEGFLTSAKHSGTSPVYSNKESVAAVAPERKVATILVVDDSPVNLQLVRSTLEPSGYRVTPVESVPKALEEISRGSFDLIMSDLHMPGTSGFEFLRQAKAEPRTRDVPFIMFTNSTNEQEGESREHALRLGAERFILRPIEPASLLALIDSILQAARVR